MDGCSHLELINDVTPHTKGCEECLQMGDKWVHLRICKIYGHVGCCDNSKNLHAAKHFHSTGHPLEPRENWGYFYLDDIYFESL